MNDIFSVEEASELLGCEPDTLREKTPAIVPGFTNQALGLRPDFLSPN